jgi:pimeloyl-ACP methyl ester carboxylesterase
MNVMSKVSWQRLDSELGSVEGKLHLPPEQSGRLIIFEPGFPGGGASDFEHWHVGRLLAAGNAVFVIRHNGTRLDDRYASQIINCPDRLAEARNSGENVLGGSRDYTLSDWLLEPAIAIEALAAKFDTISLIAHSFGAVCTLYSLLDLQNNLSVHLAKVHRAIFLAGAIGRVRLPSDPQWNVMLDDAESREKVAIGGASQNLPALQSALRRAHHEASNLPETIDVVLIHPHGDLVGSVDEVIGVHEPLELIASMGRGTLIIDKTEIVDAERGTFVHDMSALPTDALLKLLSPGWKSPSQILVFSGDSDILD